MENLSPKQSFKNMFYLIKKSKGAFLTAFILVLIPVLIISCYSFYAVYGGTTGMDFSSVKDISMEDMITGSTEMQEAMYAAMPTSSYEATFADSFLDILSSLMIYVLDAYVILLAIQILFDRRNDDSSILKVAIKKMFILIIISLLTSWIIYQIQSTIASAVFVFLFALYTANKIFIMSAAIVMLIFIGLSLLFASWILLYIRHMTIATVSGRCRFLIALGYSREILKGKVWKSMFKLMPFIGGGIIIPFMMQSFAIAFASDVRISVALVAVSTVIQLLSFMLMWVYTVPEFIVNEQTSGIQQKLREMFEHAVNMRKNQQTEDNNTENNQKTEDNGEDKKE